MKVAVVHGPNLNLLGRREPEIYGDATLESIDAALREEGLRLGIEVESFQSNHEGALIDFIHERAGMVDGFLVNAGGYSHSSVALLDALTAVARPYVEVHLTNLAAREPFRAESLLGSRAAGIVMGFGPSGYLLGLQGLLNRIRVIAPDAGPLAGRIV